MLRVSNTALAHHVQPLCFALTLLPLKFKDARQLILISAIVRGTTMINYQTLAVNVYVGSMLFGGAVIFLAVIANALGGKLIQKSVSALRK